MPLKVSLPLTGSRIAESEKMIAGGNAGSMSIKGQNSRISKTSEQRISRYDAFVIRMGDTTIGT
jgi:hypothetical protein